MPDLSYLTDLNPDRFDIRAGDETMKAVLTIGNGGFDKLNYTEVRRPQPLDGEVLIRVSAAGVNNTEINTRLGWYSSSVTQGTDDFSDEKDDEQLADGGWNAKTPFPFIQGTDCCGEVVDCGAGADKNLLGKRVLVRACMRLYGYQSLENIWMASDFDGAFAEYVRVPASEVFAINCDWSDAELATIPCAYGTSENMVHRAGVSASDTVLVTGASGGVGSAVVQLCKRRGARVVAVAGRSKWPQLEPLGIDQLLDRGDDPLQVLGQSSVDVVIDNVAGEAFEHLIKLMRRGGRYASSGAIAGPIVTLDMRDFYLKDITLIGCTSWDEPVFGNLVGYIERGEIQPLLAKTYPLSNIVMAQQEFLKKSHVGNFVLLPGS